MATSPNRILASLFGAIYVVVGLVGFAVTGGVDFFATNNGELLLGLFMVNPLHNIAHLLIGAALLIAGLSSIRSAKAVNTIVGAAYLLLGFVGLFLVTSSFNFLALNAADNVLHFGSAVVLLGVGLAADRQIGGRRAVRV